MKKNKEINTKKGIILIFIIITIVILILVVKDYKNNSLSANQGKIDNEETETVGEIQYTDEETSYIGYYVYVDGQYGVIYADLAFEVENVQWINSNGTYSYKSENHENLKKYYLNGTYDPEGEGFGEMPVLAVDETQGGTIDRFYVMALTNYSANGYTSFYWDKNFNVITCGTSTEFGIGKDNTELLIEYMDEKPESEWADQDIWNNLTISSRWFVPSIAELSAFAEELDINTDNFLDFNLRGILYSSSHMLEGMVWGLSFDEPCVRRD